MDDVIITIRCGIEQFESETPPPGAVRKSVVEAIEEALHYAEARGYNHTLSDAIGIVIKEVKAV